MIKLFYKSIEDILLSDSSLDTQLKSLRDLLADSLRSDVFRLNCVDEVLETLENWNERDTLWNAPAFFYHTELKFSVRMIFWPAFYENNPHEHKTWSVTGIFYNFLNISTYELLNGQRALKKNRSFDAVAGQAGSLIPGCIHNVKNPTHELSGSIHIFNNLDVLHPEDNAIWYPVPRKYNMSKGLVERALSVCLMSICNIKSAKSLEKVKRIYELAPISVKLSAIKVMYGFDRILAKKYFEAIEVEL